MHFALRLAVLGTLAISGYAQATPGQRILRYLHDRGEALNITAASPIRAAYIDSRDVVFSRPDLAIRRAVAQGFNVIFISFVRPSAGAVSIVDACEAWEAAFSSLGRAAIAATVASAHANGTVLLASAGGSTETPYGLVDAAWYGRFVTQWAQANLLDGVDFNFENIARGFRGGGISDATTLVGWISNATLAARTVFNTSIITHSPLAAYFGAVNYDGGNVWTGPTGGYSGVVRRIGAGAIDWFNVQFYNAESTCYSSYASLFFMSSADPRCTTYPGTALAEIVAQSGLPGNKFVVGKPLFPEDALDGYVSAPMLRSWAAQARTETGWEAGFAAWQWSYTYGSGWVAALDGVTDPLPPPTPSQSSSISGTSSVTQSQVTRSMTPSVTPSVSLSPASGAEPAAASISTGLSESGWLGVALGCVFFVLVVVVVVAVVCLCLARQRKAEAKWREAASAAAKAAAAAAAAAPHTARSGASATTSPRVSPSTSPRTSPRTVWGEPQPPMISPRSSARGAPPSGMVMPDAVVLSPRAVPTPRSSPALPRSAPAPRALGRAPTLGGRPFSAREGSASPRLPSPAVLTPTQQAQQQAQQPGSARSNASRTSSALQFQFPGGPSRSQASQLPHLQLSARSRASSPPQTTGTGSGRSQGSHQPTPQVPLSARSQSSQPPPPLLPESGRSGGSQPSEVLPGSGRSQGSLRASPPPPPHQRTSPASAAGSQTPELAEAARPPRSPVADAVGPVALAY